MQGLIDIELAFLFDSMSRINRISRLLRPKTMAYWTDIFPYLNDESEYKSHFRILRSTSNRLLSILQQHSNYLSTPSILLFTTELFDWSTIHSLYFDGFMYTAALLYNLDFDRKYVWEENEY